VRGRPERTVVLLKPAESLTFECRLDPETMPAGEYSAQLEYYSKGLLGAPEDLKSNVLKFKVGR